MMHEMSADSSENEEKREDLRLELKASSEIFIGNNMEYQERTVQ